MWRKRARRILEANVSIIPCKFGRHRHSCWYVTSSKPACICQNSIPNRKYRQVSLNWAGEASRASRASRALWWLCKSISTSSFSYSGSIGFKIQLLLRFLYLLLSRAQSTLHSTMAARRPGRLKVSVSANLPKCGETNTVPAGRARKKT